METWNDPTPSFENCKRDEDWGTERGCVVLDQPQHAASSRRLRTSHALRLVFDTAALRSHGAGRAIQAMLLPHVARIPAPGSGVHCSLLISASLTFCG